MMMIAGLKAIIGLGNPGAKHTQNRHNIGFLVLGDTVLAFLQAILRRDYLQSVLATQIQIIS